MPYSTTTALAMSQAQEGLLAPKDRVYPISEGLFMAKGRSMVAGKGGSRQRVYFCDQKKQGCPAACRWTKQKNDEWKLTSVRDDHQNCGGATTSASLRGVNGVLAGIVQTDMNISGPKLKKAAEAATGAKLSLRSVQRAKQKFGELTDAEEAEHMAKLRPYMAKLKEGSPGTVTDVEADADGAMTRCFVMTGKAVHVAQTTGVKAASMDAGFLKTAHRGQLITLCIKDDNNKLLLVTFAIVEKEDEDTYTYFLRNCMKSAVFRATFDSEDMTFFIDGHKGSPPALVSCVPHAVVHRCLQHYLKNAPAIGSDLLHNVYNAARAPTRAHFDSYMRRVQELKPATYAHLMTVLPLSSWTHHAGKQGTRIGDTVTSNNAESVINMVGAEVRGKVPLKMVEAIVDMTAAKCAAAATTGDNTSELVTPHAVKSFDAERALSNGLVVKDYGSDTFKVESGGLRQGSNTVDLKFGSPEDGGHVMRCTCGFCVRHGIPCRHVLAAAKHVGRLDIARELIDGGYNAQKYRAAYGNPAFRIRPPSLDALERDLTLFPPKPVANTAGRPKGVRKRKRVASNGEHNTSSRYNTRMSAPAGGGGQAAAAGAAAAGGAAGPTLSQPTLSQPTLSQQS